MRLMLLSLVLLAGCAKPKHNLYGWDDPAIEAEWQEWERTNIWVSGEWEKPNPMPPHLEL